MAVKKATKQYTVFSDNEKMDTSGLAGKPRQFEPMQWTPPKMTLKDIMEVQEMKTNKRPEVEDSNMACD